MNPLYLLVAVGMVAGFYLGWKLASRNLTDWITACTAAESDRDELSAEVAKLRQALERAHQYGIHSLSYDSGVSHALSKWVAGGMTGPLPTFPHYIHD